MITLELHKYFLRRLVTKHTFYGKFFPLYKTCSERVLSFFSVSYPLSDSQVSLVYQDKLSTTDMSSFLPIFRFIKYCNEAPIKGFLLCFKAMRVLLINSKIQSYSSLSCIIFYLRTIFFTSLPVNLLLSDSV